MYCVRKVTNDLYWVGANDHRLALFENCFPIPRGVSYNAYCLLDEKTVLFDTVDWSACRQLLENLAYVLDGRELDYLLVNHLEPDHAACIEEILLRHPKVKLISNEKAFMLMRQFGFHVDGHECIEVKEGDTFSFGKHTVTFVGAPMVHWPEAMVTLDVTDGVLFSADAFGTFGALDGKLFADEVDFERDWLDDARRYLTNIVGKYGPHIQLLLKKAGGGQVFEAKVGDYLARYDVPAREATDVRWAQTCLALEDRVEALEALFEPVFLRRMQQKLWQALYYQYEITQPFLPQLEKNLVWLEAELEKLSALQRRRNARFDETIEKIER